MPRGFEEQEDGMPAPPLTFEVPDSVRQSVLERASWRCENPYCPQPLTALTEVDHVVSRAAGGTHDPTNLQCLCRTCNRVKGSAPEHEFRSRALVSLWNTMLSRRLQLELLPSTPDALTSALATRDRQEPSNSPTMLDLLQAEPHRLWGQVDVRSANECWPWQGYVNKKSGRPELRIRVGNGKSVRMIASRAALTVKLNRMLQPAPAEMACHVCDNELCCNPAHLWPGTNAENLADMASKGRSLSGQDNPNARFSDEEVAHIQKLHADGMTQKQLRGRYGISKSTMSHLIRRGLGDDAPADQRRRYQPGDYNEAIRQCAAQLGAAPTLSDYKRWRKQQLAEGRQYPTFSAQVKGGIAWTDRLKAAGIATPAAS